MGPHERCKCVHSGQTLTFWRSNVFSMSHGSMGVFVYHPEIGACQILLLLGCRASPCIPGFPSLLGSLHLFPLVTGTEATHSNLYFFPLLLSSHFFCSPSKQYLCFPLWQEIVHVITSYSFLGSQSHQIHRNRKGNDSCQGMGEGGWRVNV